MEEDNKDSNKVNDPATHYTAESYKRITFFKSFEEAEEFTIKMRLKMSPEERLASVTQMLMRLYEDELKQQKKPTRIVFDH